MPKRNSSYRTIPLPHRMVNLRMGSLQRWKFRARKQSSQMDGVGEVHPNHVKVSVSADAHGTTSQQDASRQWHTAAVAVGAASAPAAAAPALEESTEVHNLHDLLGLGATLTNYEMLRNALMLPVSKLRKCPPEKLHELTFVQATIFACLELKQLHSLELLAEEIKQARPAPRVPPSRRH